ncbi:MAG: ATP-binding protein [Hydrogeniiclostridium mannosilyticum]
MNRLALCFAPKSIEKILSNLLSNAVSYTTSGHNIWVTLQSDKLIIENECEPIAQENCPVCLNLYRPDFARDRKDGGNGLGLYIVDTLCKALDLKYAFISTTSPKGMRFTLYF